MATPSAIHPSTIRRPWPGCWLGVSGETPPVPGHGHDLGSGVDQDLHQLRALYAVILHGHPSIPEWLSQGSRLAAWAEERAAAGNPDPHYQRPTPQARLAFSCVDAMRRLKAAQLAGQVPVLGV